MSAFSLLYNGIRWHLVPLYYIFYYLQNSANQAKNIYIDTNMTAKSGDIEFLLNCPFKVTYHKSTNYSKPMVSNTISS